MSRQDDAPKLYKPKRIPAGQVPEGRIGVFRKDGTLAGHVGHLCTSVTAARLSGSWGMKLGSKNGKTAWVCGSSK